MSSDPAFAKKLHDAVGLYVAPPAHAVVLSIDEKSQIQALDRTVAKGLDLHLQTGRTVGNLSFIRWQSTGRPDLGLGQHRRRLAYPQYERLSVL